MTNRFNPLSNLPNFDRLLGSDFTLQRSMAQLQDAIMPSHVRVMMGLHESLEKLAPRRVAGLPDLFAPHEAFDGRESLLARIAGTSELLRQHDLLGSFATSQQLITAGALRSAFGPELTWATMPSIRLAQGLERMMPELVGLEWRRHLLSTLAPAFELAATVRRSVGLLAFLPAPGDGASVTWIADEDKPPAIAALVAAAPRLPKIDIETTVHCAFCGGELVQHDQSFRWKGTRARLEIGVIPICSECVRRSRTNPDYFRDALEALVRPPLKLVSSTGSTDGVPRGKGKGPLMNESSRCHAASARGWIV